MTTLRMKSVTAQMKFADVEGLMVNGRKTRPVAFVRNVGVAVTCYFGSEGRILGRYKQSSIKEFILNSNLFIAKQYHTHYRILCSEGLRLIKSRHFQQQRLTGYTHS